MVGCQILERGYRDIVVCQILSIGLSHTMDGEFVLCDDSSLTTMGFEISEQVVRQ